MKALPKRKGNPVMEDHARVCSVEASMKAPPKRKGNPLVFKLGACIFGCLNESPSEKEGKS